MKNEAAARLGQSGGLKKSEKKTAACRKNATKPRARWVTAIYFEALTPHGMDSGLTLQKGVKKWDLVNNGDEITKFIEEQLNGQTIIEIFSFQTMSHKI